MTSTGTRLPSRRRASTLIGRPSTVSGVTSAMPRQMPLAVLRRHEEVATCSPTASSSVHPNVRSAAAFHSTTTPARLVTTTGS